MKTKSEDSSINTLNNLLQNLINEPSDSKVSLGSILDNLNQKSFALLMMVLVLPNCIPIPSPIGVSTVFSLPLLLISGQLVFGRKTPWIPESWKRYSINRSLLTKFINTLYPYLKRIGSILKPRMLFLILPGTERFLGVCWLIFALTIAIPVPLTNFLPGVGILISSMGMLEKDGLAMIIGLVIGFIGVIFTALLLTVGVVFFTDIIPFLR
ncbi:MAG: exopolysaccharide biosynthesis protein [Alphaproteobacteria bacterium]|nr:exopolysaccharide biosynthesis protein [Alphaproteobacteria bacterium]